MTAPTADGKARARRGRGEGSVRQLPSGRWWARLTAGKTATGAQDRRTATFDTKREALAWLRERQAELARGRLASPGRQTLGEFLASWLAHKKAEVEHSTYAFYERQVRLHLTPNIGAVKLAVLAPAHVHGLYAAMAGKGASADLQHKAATTLRAALADAVSLNLIPTNPALAVRKPKVRPKERKAMTREQVRKFLSVARAHRLGALYELALDAGMRPGELLALHWPDVDLENRLVHVRRALEEVDGKFRLKAPKTERGLRSVPITPATAEALRRHREAMKAEGRDVEKGPVFVSRRGGWISQPTLYAKVFKPLLAAAGLPPEFSPYALRHTCATLLLQAGVSIKVVSERLGHESIDMTLKHYAHVLPDMQQKAVEVMEALLGNDQVTARIRRGFSGNPLST